MASAYGGDAWLGGEGVNKHGGTMVFSQGLCLCRIVTVRFPHVIEYTM